MRAFVFTDRALERHAGRYVWLSIDTEKDVNAPFLAKYPISAYPTLLVIDAAREETALRWLGAVTVGQMERLLNDGERALRGDVKGADAALARADRRMGAGDNRRAAASFRKALAKAPPGWPPKERAVESLLTVLALEGDHRGCAEVAAERLPSERGPHYAAVAAAGLSCALALPPEDGSETVERFEAAARAAVADPPLPIAADDLSAIHGLLVEARTAMEDEAGARAAATAWLRYLEAQAAAAGSAEQRAVFDPHRLAAAIAAGEPARAIPPLEQSARDFPEDYNPPARLAVAYKETGELDKALGAADRALTLAYGPRKVRVFMTRADVQVARGDTAGARATLEDALRYAEALPEAQRSERSVEAIRRRIEALPPPG
jgi:tetratricopeptide (TPR) repeat protein